MTISDAERAKQWALANPERYRENQRKWREKNRAKAREYSIAYRKENAAQIKQRRDKTDPARHHRYHQKRYAKPEYVVKTRARAKKWRDDHPGTYNENSTKWRKENPEAAKAIARAGSINRRAREVAAGKISAADVRFIRSTKTCAACGRKRSRMEIDHIIALSRGGTNHRSNLQLLCRPCNRTKHAKDPITWAQQNGRLL